MVYFGYTLADHSVLALGRQCAAAELVLQMYSQVILSAGLALAYPFAGHTTTNWCLGLDKLKCFTWKFEYL
jgi:hypothetical protein